MNGHMLATPDQILAGGVLLIIVTPALGELYCIGRDALHAVRRWCR